MIPLLRAQLSLGYLRHVKHCKVALGGEFKTLALDLAFDSAI